MYMWADSVHYVEDAGTITLIGHARYLERGNEITARQLQYIEQDAHIIATGDVHIRTKRSTLTSQLANYFRPVPGIRPASSAFAVGGPPHAVLRDTAGSKDTSVTIIDGQRISMAADSIFGAKGNAVINRTDLTAKADSIEANSAKQTMRLLGGNPHVEGLGTNKFSLDGNVLDVFGRERAIERLLAKGKAVAVNDSLKLTSDTLDIRMSRNHIDSVAAWGGGVAHATSPDRDIRGKRIDLSMPGGRMRRLFAVGAARADSKPDSTVHSPERDWIEGDTLTATFTVPKDTTKRPQLDTVIARGKARSFYHVAPKEKADTIGGINYSSGTRIDIALKANGKQDVHVIGQVHGMSLEAEKKDTTTGKAKAAAPKKPPPPRRVP